MENRPSIDDILIQWDERHGHRYRKDNRDEAIRELLAAFVRFGYSRSAVVGAEKKIMKCLVGPRSPHGKKGLDDWYKICKRSLALVVSETFTEKIDFATANNVKAPYEPASESEAMDELQAPLIPEITEETYEEPKATWAPSTVVRPELDRSQFQNVKTTPVQSDEEFWAALEREANEQ